MWGRVAFLWAGIAAAIGLAGCQRPPPDGAALAEWAYPHASTAVSFDLPPGRYTVPGSPVTLDAAQASSDETPADWFPEQGPPPPPVVATKAPPQGRADGPTPCGACHLIRGQGFLGTPNLAGLPAAYIEEQVRAFREGRRVSWSKDIGSTKEMIEVARKATDAEVAAAAGYFAALPMTRRYRVVESQTAPAVKPDKFGWLDVVPGAPREPIRGRNVEVAEDFTRMLISDPTYQVTIYVPPGSVAKGAALVASGGAAGQPCAACHGQDLKGQGAVPALAGRSAAYLARQLWDIRTGARHGPEVAAMQPIAAKLAEADIAPITAYLASLAP